MINEFYAKLLASFRDSERDAYVYYGERYTFRDLYGRMLKINGFLAARRQQRIVLYGSKNVNVYAALYAIVLSGNVWVPFTPGYPANRLLEMMSALDASVIMYDEELPAALSDYAAKSGIETVNVNSLVNGRGAGAEFAAIDRRDSDLAYIMFTSGSTGAPKGVPMTNINYINFVNNAMDILPFRKGEVFSDYHDFAFDISIFYLFCAPLSESAISPIRKDEERIFPVKHFQDNEITVWSSVPSVISRIQRLRPDERIENKFRILFICGEPFSLSVLRYCYENLNAENVYDFYGLTETGVENFYHKCSKDDLTRFEDRGFVPIGKPLKGSDIMVTPDKELLLSGCQVTPGYLRGIEAARFEAIDGKRWYHTGDIVEMFEGVYFCKGRVDSQVKLSGYRVEMMDIEVHVRRYPGVKEAVCFVDDSGKVKTLVCTYEPEKASAVDIKAMRASLAAALPDYMVPKKFCPIDDMPRNNNGKLDRKRVRERYQENLARERVGA